MPKFLVANRRLIYTTSGGVTKFIQDATPDCICCDEDAHAPCGYACLDDLVTGGQNAGLAFGWCNHFGSSYSAIDACIPTSLYVKIEGIEADGVCTPFPPGHSFKAHGTGNIVGCIPYYNQAYDADHPPTGPIDPSAIIYFGIVDAPGWRMDWWEGDEGCVGAPKYRFASDRVAVMVAFYLLDQTVPANVGKYGVRVVVTSCSGGWVIFSSESTYSATGTTTTPFIVAIPSGSAVVTPCKGFTVNGSAKQIHTYNSTTGVVTPPASGIDIYVGGGSATVKFCCASPTQLTCTTKPGPTRWYQARRCLDNTLLEVWVPIGWLTVDGTTAYLIGGAPSCVYFKEEDGRDFDAGVTPYNAFGYPSIRARFPSCALCLGVILEVRDCDGDAVIGYVDPDDVDQTKVYGLGGVCVYFAALAGEQDPDLPTFVAADFSGSVDECVDCSATSCPGNSYGTGASTIATTLTQNSECTTAGLPDTAFNVSSTGGGDWDGFSGSGDQEVFIQCSGKYWVASWEDFVTGIIHFFQTLRTSDEPRSSNWTWTGTLGDSCADTNHPTFTTA